MVLKHADIWRAIDGLAAREGLSPSGLAKKAGLSSTSFNPSKRATAKRKHWPSTESLAQILQITNTGFDDFIALMAPNAITRTILPFATLGDALQSGMFDDEGHPSGKNWDQFRFPVLADPHAFALEVNGRGMEPVYRDGTVIVLSPAEKPRRGDRVAMRIKKGGIDIGQLGRESTQKLEFIALNPATPATAISRNTIEWIYRIVWASQ